MSHTHLSKATRAPYPSLYHSTVERMRGMGGERKERGKEGSMQTTALLRVISQHHLEGSLLNFRLKANIHREVGQRLGQVHSRQKGSHC